MGIERAATVSVGTMTSRQLVNDIRSAPRYRGELEPIDTKAGHVPGALNRPFSDNLDASGRFKSAERLRPEFYALIGAFQSWQVVHMRGSGATACHNLLAMEAAGCRGRACMRRLGVGGFPVDGSCQ
jgi:thiosulfate/3-mercaptopyruvate sulfurtransferase